jgi:hypothetical protein
MSYTEHHIDYTLDVIKQHKIEKKTVKLNQNVKHNIRGIQVHAYVVVQSSCEALLLKFVRVVGNIFF